MSVQLLDKTRKINKLLHNSNTGKFVFSDICNVLGEILASNVLVISRKGKLLGISQQKEIDSIKEMLCGSVGECIDSELNERLLNILSTKENVNLTTLGFMVDNIRRYNAIILPIVISGERLGTLFIYRPEESYEIDDIIISEYGTTVVGLEMIRAVSEENEIEIRKHQIISSAINTLSFSEHEAIRYVFEELDGEEEGVIVASRLAEKVNITRSVIVNALRKFESAGVIETRSNGMKGTYIRVLNELAYNAV